MERIGRYRILRELGRGGFATVFLAEDPALHDHVAIKMLSETHSADPDIVARFISEARVMRNLAAPGLVTIHDTGEVGGRPYFVMEYCARGTVSDRLANLPRTLTVEEGVGLARAIGTAMAGVHRADPPIVHRDLKPENLLIRATRNRDRPPIGDFLASDEEVIVGDFGLAKMVSSTTTRLSLVAFTRGFAAPEQVRGDPTIGPSADVYSASAIIIRALSGTPPEQVLAPDDRAFAEPALAATGFLRPHLERGLSYDRRARQPDLVDWANDLATPGRWAPPRPAAPPSQPVVTPSQPVAPSPQPVVSQGQTTSKWEVTPARPRRRRTLLVGTLLVAMIGIGALIWWNQTTGAPIVGPTRGVVGDEVAFTVPGATVERWRAGGQSTDGPVLVFTPSATGPVTIQAVTDEGESELTFTISPSSSALAIEGPGLLPIGEVTVLSVSDPVVTEPVWTVGDQDLHQPTLELRPTSPGLITVVLTTGGGERVERTFTAG